MPKGTHPSILRFLLPTLPTLLVLGCFMVLLPVELWAHSDTHIQPAASSLWGCMASLRVWCCRAIQHTVFSPILSHARETQTRSSSSQYVWWCSEWSPVPEPCRPSPAIVEGSHVTRGAVLAWTCEDATGCAGLGHVTGPRHLTRIPPLTARRVYRSCPAVLPCVPPGGLHGFASGVVLSCYTAYSDPYSPLS